MEAQKYNKPLKYLGYAVVCEEVPDEISLAFNISGCPYHCEGCHSEYLWEYAGELLSQNIKNILADISEMITCVCFLGGDQNISELSAMCRKVKYDYGLKTCIYAGADSFEKFLPIINDGCLDYLKLGRYKSECGGLDNPNTNQRMYKYYYQDGEWTYDDITYRFQTSSTIS